MIFWLVLELKISYNRVIIISWRILVSFRGIFGRLYFCMVKYLSFLNSSFALKNTFWQGPNVTHHLLYIYTLMSLRLLARYTKSSRNRVPKTISSTSEIERKRLLSHCSSTAMTLWSKQGITNTLALPIDKMLYINLLCPHQNVPTTRVGLFHFFVNGWTCF